ncbi:sensor histidine kinase [Paenibacillus spongiae]|uniref:histidine kinase n=1 Tax=Paenibacillus spongiae TaxID=2909671 RepID=A0ABY5S0J1_9BACL|nr:sensor histidine kinase [Paenibacillus spongiae]UVI27367.1 sensor histidine kinase [Paenibacillus spongiae]
MKIRTKIFMANTLVAIILLGALTFITTRYSSNLLLSKMEEDVGYSVSQLSENVDNLLQSYEQVVDALYANSDLKDQIAKRYDNFLESYDVYLDEYIPFVNWVRSSSRNVLRVMTYTDNPTFQFADVRLIDQEIRQTPWYVKSQQSDMPLVKTWTYLGKDTYYRFGVFRLSQKVSGIGAEGNNVMYVAIDLPDRVLYDLVTKENSKQRFLIALPDGRIVVDNMDQSYDKKLSDSPFYSQIKGKSFYTGMYRFDDGSKYLLTAKELTSRGSIRGLKVINLTPIDELQAKVREIQQLAILLFALAVIVSVLALYFISAGLTKRLMQLANRMQRTDADNLQSFIEVKGNDEISRLGYIFNRMILRIDKLIKEVYESELDRKELELKKKESELYALQTQINPHYLFNTLNAIRGNLLEKGDKENAKIVKLLATSFRNVLSQSGQVVRLSEEIDIVDTYLRIQEFRFGERLAYDVHIPRELHQLEMPRLTLQTLVENAVVHALEKNEEMTTIVIRARIVDRDRYCATVEDNGPGITSDRLDEIIGRLNEPEGSDDGKRIGLRNVHQRLRRLYGSSYGIEFESVPGSGTKVTVVLPVSQ